MPANEYVQWSVKLLYYICGVASTIVGSWISSKIRVYHDARNSHRDDLKRRVLEPLRKSLASYVAPRFTVLYQAQQYNPQAPSAEYPSTYGPSVSVEIPGSPELDDALLQDAHLCHYPDLIDGFAGVKRIWAAEVVRHKAFIQATAEEILTASGLPAFPAPDGPYVMHWNLGTFVYNRLVVSADARLWMQAQADGQIPDCHILSDGGATVAKGSKQQMQNLVQSIDAVLAARRGQASEFQAGLAKLKEQQRALSQQLSLAIAEKKLRNRCALVTFF